ncbi:hypothetical protein [Micromonospora marina]|uniref:hypothetical protein n=1 Tax=Micromonospora marina TaxID=307120 RepID=UPI0034529B1A
MSAPHGPSGLAGYVTMQCLASLGGCDDLACVCACHSDTPSDDRFCVCEAYDCAGECCGVGNCSCTPAPGDPHPRGGE